MNREIIPSRSGALYPKHVGSFSKSLSLQKHQQEKKTLSKVVNLKQVPDRDPDGYRIIRQIHPLHAEKLAKYETASHLQELLTTWMVIADDAQAQIYEGKKIPQDIATGDTAERFEHNRKLGREWTLVSNGIIATKPVESSQINAGSHAEGYSEKLLADVVLHNNAHFVQSIVNRLHHSFSKLLFDRLVLVASPGMIVELKERLNRGVQDSIIGIMSRNITNS